NDYESLTHKKGLPDGHASIIREVVVPVFRESKVVAILGVGNKNNFYDDDDVEMISKLADLAWDITERKRTEQALKESEEKYKMLFDASPIGIGIADMNGKIINSNPVMKQITGYDFENEKDVVANDMYLNKEDREILLDHLSKNGCARDWEVDLKRKDGLIYNALLNVDFIQIGNEKFILTNMRDISNRKRGEKALRENEELKQTVLDSLNANVAVVDSKGNIISVNSPWEKFALSNGIKKLEGTVEKINYFDVLCRSVENGEKNADKVYEGIKSVLNGEIQYFETEYPCDSPSEKRWFVMHVLPLVNKSGVVISHENITERKIAEDQLRQSEERLKLLNLMQRDQNAELIDKNTELKKARLSTLNIIEDLSREIREHKIAEEKLKANEQKFKTVADFTYDWEYWEGKNSEIIYMSPSCQRITGYTREDFIANSSLMERIIVPEDAFKFISHHHDIAPFDKRDEVEELEFSIVHKNGSIKNIFHICRPIFDENKKYLGRRVSNRDVSEKKQIEIELRKSEAQYHELYSLMRLMSDTMPDMLWAKDLEQKYLFTNKSFSENLLCADNTDEPIGKTDLFFAERQRRLHPENLEWHTFGELCQDTDTITLQEMKHMQFDEYGNVKGKFLYLDVHKAPLINDHGELIGTVGSARNITESKAAEKALRESESRNRAFLNAIPDLIFILSQDGIFIDYKSEREELLLLPPENFVGKHIREVLPEKLAILTIEKIGALFVEGKIQVYEYSIEQNGQIKHFENRLVLSGDNQILSIIRDITNAKESEEQIKRLSHAIEQSKATIIITSVTGDIEYFNPMLTEITGYTFEELKGKNISILGSGNGNDKTEQAMWNNISIGKDWSGEFLNKKKNGELYWASAVVSPIKNNKDEIVNFIAIQEDITHQKQLTKELIEAKEKAEEMNKVKSYFFANMSHELRTPFVGILGFSEMLAEAIPDPELK
ncbi:MAG: PAS domain S-box protein, partial [Ignavibacteria bacterium]|nr:PAS domain S-box protein [Ignavibacteria bacterium]